MSDIAIKAENVGKLYRLGQIGTGTLSHDLNRWWAQVRGKEDPFAKIGEANDRTKKGESDYVWALQDVDFEIKKGNAVGIIGRNGAGKSTLLKLLSKVTKPTSGNIKVNGRIASLLEVGTGFHPEMTGRENIYLNGAILGMRKKEIDRKFDEIVDFSGVERYIDTPVKRYSSGMYIRLAFAVAAHLESEILIVDEVLAVGDAEFQKKCLGKMSDVSKGEGRTVLFVSHNLTAVKELCEFGLLMGYGSIKFQGSSLETVNEYQKTLMHRSAFSSKTLEENIFYNSNIRLLNFEVINEKGTNIFFLSDNISVEFSFYNSKENINLAVSAIIKNYEEIVVAELGKIISSQSDSRVGVYTICFTIPKNILNAGNYYFDLLFAENQTYVISHFKEVVNFEIINEIIGNNTNPLPGILRLNLDYSVKYSNCEYNDYA